MRGLAGDKMMNQARFSRDLKFRTTHTVLAKFLDAALTEFVRLEACEVLGRPPGFP